MRLILTAILASIASCSKRRVIVDQDATGPGTTNTVSIALLLCDPDIHVEAITVATGDGWVGPEVSHVLRLLELMNRTDVRVIPGSAGPLMPLTRDEVHLQAKMYGNISWTGAWEKPGAADPYAIDASDFPEGLPSRSRPYTADGGAAEFIASAVRSSPGEISLIALAPMTNIARALAIEPRLPSLAKELVVAAGSFGCGRVAGRVSAPSHCDAGPFAHEFNLWFDPHAARTVLRAVPYVVPRWQKLTLLPADLTSQPLWTGAMRQAVTRATNASAAARYIAAYLLPSVNVNYPMFDEFAIAWWLECGGGRGPPLAASCALTEAPSVVQMLDVVLEDRTRGMLLSWPDGHGPGHGEQPTEVHLGLVQLAAFVTTVHRLLASEDGAGAAA